MVKHIFIIFVGALLLGCDILKPANTSSDLSAEMVLNTTVSPNGTQTSKLTIEFKRKGVPESVSEVFVNDQLLSYNTPTNGYVFEPDQDSVTKNTTFTVTVVINKDDLIYEENLTKTTLTIKEEILPTMYLATANRIAGLVTAPTHNTIESIPNNVVLGVFSASDDAIFTQTDMSATFEGSDLFNKTTITLDDAASFINTSALNGSSFGFVPTSLSISAQFHYLGTLDPNFGSGYIRRTITLENNAISIVQP